MRQSSGETPAVKVQHGPYVWHHCRKSGLNFRPESGSEEPLDRYGWRTEPWNPSLRTRPTSLHRLLPFLRSLSDSGTNCVTKRTELKKNESDEERRTLSVGRFFRSVSLRIHGVHRDREQIGMTTTTDAPKLKLLSKTRNKGKPRNRKN